MWNSDLFFLARSLSIIKISVTSCFNLNRKRSGERWKARDFMLHRIVMQLTGLLLKRFVIGVTERRIRTSADGSKKRPTMRQVSLSTYCGRAAIPEVRQVRCLLHL